MNFTPFNGQFSGSIPAAAVHQFAAAKFAQNISTTNGTPVGQVLGVLSGGEGGVHYLRSIETATGLQSQQQQIITVPITVPGVKPGDPQQTVQIQVMSPNVSGLNTQPTLQQPKYQMAQIPIQTFQQGELGTAVLTLAYATPDNPEGMQIIGNAGLPEGIQVVAAIQAQDVQQMLAAHLPTHDVSGGGGAGSGGCITKQEYPSAQAIHLGAILPTHSQLTNVMEDSKKNILNNNNLRIKQEVILPDDPNLDVSEAAPQWTLAPGAELADYITRVQNCGQLPVSLHQFLRFNSSVQSIKREGSVSSALSGSQSMESSQDEDDLHSGDVSMGIGIGEEGEILGGDNSKDASLEDVNIQSEIILPDDENPKAKKKKKYKKKPPKPKKPKPGQVVIATASDGTTLYCCPECHMAYPDKELLEQHLVGHKIERRYICGICGAGLKRREHLERHKMGHNPDRPYVCSVCLKGFKRKEHLNLHYVIHSGTKNEICQECGKGFYRKDHLRKHVRSHATRRAKEEQMLQGQQNRVNTQQNPSAPNQPNNQHQLTVSSNNQVPSSTIPVPVQITVPHHIVTMANNAAAANQQALNIKQDMEELLIQQITRGENENEQT